MKGAYWASTAADRVCLHIEVIDMAKQKKTYKVGRDAETGRFLPLDVAKRRKKTAVVETVKR